MGLALATLVLPAKFLTVRAVTPLAFAIAPASAVWAFASPAPAVAVTARASIALDALR
ncbi:MAG TPA: hypothetical protein VH640_17910 [Bryobacteraceae bacterium]